MSNYNKIIPTLAGNNLLVESIKSKKPLIFTKIALGDGTLLENESIENLTALKRKMCENTIQDVKNKSNGELDITATISNASVTSGFYARELGVFAKVGDNGQEKLFGYTNAGAQASYTPAGTSLDEKLITVTFYVGNDVNVKINLNSQLYITQGALDKHNEAMNAHDELLKLFLRLTGGTITGVLKTNQGNGIEFIKADGSVGAGIRLGNNGIFDVGYSYKQDQNLATQQLLLHSYLTPKWYNSNQGGVNLATENYVWESFKKVYPIGAIYISLSSTNPATLFGFGTWEALPQGRMLLSQGNEYAAGSTGGEKSHTLTIAEMPSHGHGDKVSAEGHHHHSGTTSLNGDHNHGSGNANRHEDSIFNGRYGSSTAYGTESGRENNVPQNATTTNGGHNHTFTTSDAGGHTHKINRDGGGEAHNNMPPYLAVYMWKRVK